MQLGLFESEKVLTTFCPFNKIDKNDEHKQVSCWKLVDEKLYLYDINPDHQVFLGRELNTDLSGEGLQKLSPEIHHLSLLALKQNHAVSFSLLSPDNNEEIFLISPVMPDEVTITRYGKDHNDCKLIENFTRKDKENHSRLEKAQKLAEVGKMTAYITHELKTLLASVKMNLDLIKKNLEMPAGKKKSFNIISKEIDRLNRLLREILIFSGKSDLTFVSVNLYKTIEIIRQLLAPLLIDKNIKLKNELSKFYILGDSQKIHTLFQQLIENSIEAIASNGSIEIWDEYLQKEKKRYVFIKDSGRGIKEPLKIFEPFYTNKPGGTGLGLPIVKAIAKDHNWNIHLVCSDNNGTIFRLELSELGGKHAKSFDH